MCEGRDPAGVALLLRMTVSRNEILQTILAYFRGTTNLKNMQTLFSGIRTFRRSMSLEWKVSSVMGRVEQRMKNVSYAVLTLFFAVLKASAKYHDSRNGLRCSGLREIIRRPQREIPKFTLLITLLSVARDRGSLDRQGFHYIELTWRLNHLVQAKSCGR